MTFATTCLQNSIRSIVYISLLWDLINDRFSFENLLFVLVSVDIYLHNNGHMK